ncbi:SPJ_0845 family protein [Streptococcus equi]|uniref:SPJ_0845 family protein n=1 Tax=Streptococcus equi TaxID=1336 RepID=UPI0013F5F3ED|nr:SPJ_0845 family protein [Streptococcus equi]MCD3391392.1 hypothetical protein [Streptococcus equi subsp. zooepidemicus]HEL0380705.1 hypothetical protein [Streptococcus equi subsp. zooepidemicus]HEL0394873.1 hypothetical protein [Streptococcus equi subsp. zooepidemicus]HEL0398908.1 hypothetical protein [Streptococcus equi subsp. zooepidemicus]HEL1148137.1 hypothetical protein [Streptococcus equi subsp. zooepidemicus]
MAITHKKNDQLEKMMAGFASIPDFDKPLELNQEGKLVTEKPKPQVKTAKQD